MVCEGVELDLRAGGAERMRLAERHGEGELRELVPVAERDPGTEERVPKTQRGACADDLIVGDGVTSRARHESDGVGVGVPELAACVGTRIHRDPVAY